MLYKVPNAHPVESSEPRLNVYCARGKDAWRVHASPSVPSILGPFFDKQGEVYPVLFLDFEDLAEFMSSHDAAYEMKESRLGSVELSARGDDAIALSKWLATAFASGARPALRR